MLLALENFKKFASISKETCFYFSPILIPFII